MPREHAGRDRLDRRAVGDVALLVLVGLGLGAGESDDVRPAAPQRADELGADPRRRAGDDRYLQVLTVRPAVAFRPAASTTVATSRCLPFFSFAVFHATE
jgi:hypothetical protein